MTHQAFQAVFVNFKPITSRKVLEIKLEVPIEQGGEVLSLLGMPDPAVSTWVAVAKLNPSAVSSSQNAEVQAQSPGPDASGGVETQPIPSRKWSEMPYAQRAGIRSNEKMFQEFSRTVDADDAAEFIRRVCGVSSRADIKPGTRAAAAYEDMEIKYDTWLQYERQVQGAVA